MIYLLDKPVNWTSFDLVKKVRNLVNEKAGHAGTLDPLATGLMIVATGRDTKKLQHLIGLDKVYEVEVLLGQQTDTADREGRVIRVADLDQLVDLDQAAVKEATMKLIGSHELPVPLYSAVKIDGRPLYWYARNNVDITPPTRSMLVKSLEYSSSQLDKDSGGMLVKFRLTVSSGVYIRSIAEYLGELLDLPAMMWSLRRVKIGDYKIENSITLEDIRS